MSIIASSHDWSPLDLGVLVRNWKQDAAGAWRRAVNRSGVARSLAGMLDHLLGRQPRIMFAQGMSAAYVDTAGAAPLFRWRYDDSWINGRTRRYRLLTLPRSAGAGNCYAEQIDGDGATPLINAPTGAYSWPEDLQLQEFTVERGASASAEIEDGLSTYNGYQVYDLVVQDEVLSALDSALHSFCDGSPAFPGRDLIVGWAEQFRGALQRLRAYNLPILLSWSSATEGTPGATSAAGIVVTSAAYVNVIDQTINTRTATTPGTSCHVRYCGVGAEDEAAGQSIKMPCRVRARAVGGNATVKFIGPDHIGGNSTEITVTAGAATSWWGSAANYVMLNPVAANDATTTARNKVDVHAKVAGGGTLYLYGLRGWMAYS